MLHMKHRHHDHRQPHAADTIRQLCRNEISAVSGNQDRVITDAETNFINNCLQQSATTQTMERFLQQFSISFSGAADSLLALLAALVRVDLQGSGVEGSISLLWLETLHKWERSFR